VLGRAYTEDQLVEHPAMGLFATLGWQTESALEETFGAGGTLGRETKGEVVLAPRLRAALIRLNPTLPPEAITGPWTSWRAPVCSNNRWLGPSFPISSWTYSAKLPRPSNSRLIGRSDETRHRSKSNPTDDASLPRQRLRSGRIRVTGMLLALRPKLVVDLRQGEGLAAARAGKLNQWMIRRSFRFCRYRVE
jgi:hypothetical protein